MDPIQYIRRWSSYHSGNSERGFQQSVTEHTFGMEITRNVHDNKLLIAVTAITQVFIKQNET